MLALQVPIHWAEAVAVIEELCEVLGDARGSAVRIPDLEDIAITARGSVMLRRGAPATQDIDGLGRALHALLDPAATPMSLRLFVAQSSGSEKYHSVSAYASALAYYSRPDRSELIQSLYRRCLEAPVAPRCRLYRHRRSRSRRRVLAACRDGRWSPLLHCCAVRGWRRRSGCGVRRLAPLRP